MMPRCAFGIVFHDGSFVPALTEGTLKATVIRSAWEKVTLGSPVLLKAVLVEVQQTLQKWVFKWNCKWKMNIQMEGYFSNYLSGKAQDLEVTCLATPVLGCSPPKETAIWNFQQIAKDFSRAAARKEKPAQTNVVLQSTKAITGAAGCCDHVCCCCLVLAVPRPGLASQWVPPCDDFLLDTIGTIADLSVGAEGSLLPAKTWKADFLNLV